MMKKLSELKRVPYNEFQKYLDYYLDDVDQKQVPIIVFDPQHKDKSIVVLPLAQYQDLAQYLKQFENNNKRQAK